MILNIAVIYGSVRINRQGIKAVKFIVNQLKNVGHSVELIDPLEYNLPFYEKGFADYDKSTAPDNLSRISKILSNADGFIVVTAEYNHNLPPALANLMSHFGKEYKRKAAGIASYSSGPFGGIRASITTREFLAAIGIVAIPTIFPISNVQKSFNENGTAVDENYIRRFGIFLKEFEWYVSALKIKRES